MRSARGLSAGARAITHGKQLRGQCDGTSGNGNRMGTHTGPNALLRTGTYPNVSVTGPGTGPLFSPLPIPGGGWRIDGTDELAAGGACTLWASGASTVYAYNNNPANTGGIVPSGGLVIDGFPVPAGTYVFQFWDWSGYGPTMYNGAPGVVFRGCRARSTAYGSGSGYFPTDLGPPAFNSPLWFLYCDMGGCSAPDVLSIPLKIEASGGVTIYRTYFSYTATDVQPNGSTGAIDIIETFHEKLTHHNGDHLNGISTSGGETNCRFLRNSMVFTEYDENGVQVQDTDCIAFFWDTMGQTYPGSGLNPDGTPGYQVTGNYMGGTGYCFYPPTSGKYWPGGSAQPSNVVFRDNLITTGVYPVNSTSDGPGGGYDGPIYGGLLWGANGNAQSNNLWADGTYAGKPIAGTTFTASPAAPTTVYCVNYFPAANGGWSMWLTGNYSGTQYEADMATAKGLGFNTMRVILAAASSVTFPGAFDFPSPTSPELANWADFYSRAKTVGMNLHVTLFDQFGDYGRIDDCETWITAILGALPDTANIAVIEIQNEVPFSSAASYTSAGGTYDAGWTLGETGNTVGYVALAWAALMIPHIRTAAPGIPVTASTTNAPSGDLAAFYGAANGQAWAPDWWDWHCYAGSPQLACTAICGAISAVGNNPPQLVIGECGLDSAPTGTQGTLQAQQAQADYLQAVRWACAQQGMPEPSPWILFDLGACPQFPSGQTFGLLTTSGTPKLSGQMYQAIPPGSRIPAVDLNGSMRGSQADTGGSTLPVRWALYRGNGGAQPVTAVIDTVNTYLGAPSVLLGGSAATSGSDNPPALQSGPVMAAYPGFGYTFSVALKGTGSTGTTNLEASWFDDTGTYISSTNGSALTLAGTFTPYTLSTTAPSNAAYALLSVNVGYNAGSIWAAGARWALG